MFPGIAGYEIMERNQWEASMHMSETVMGIPENPMRLRMEEAARMAGLKYIVNVVYDINKDDRRVLLRRCRSCPSGREQTIAGGLCRPSANARDIVVIDSHSADRDFWQSAKGPYAGHDGGEGWRIHDLRGSQSRRRRKEPREPAENRLPPARGDCRDGAARGSRRPGRHGDSRRHVPDHRQDRLHHGFARRESRTKRKSWASVTQRRCRKH